MNNKAITFLLIKSFYSAQFESTTDLSGQKYEYETN